MLGTLGANPAVNRAGLSQLTPAFNAAVRPLQAEAMLAQGSFTTALELVNHPVQCAKLHVIDVHTRLGSALDRRVTEAVTGHDSCVVHAVAALNRHEYRRRQRSTKAQSMRPEEPTTVVAIRSQRLGLGTLELEREMALVIGQGHSGITGGQSLQSREGLLIDHEGKVLPFGSKVNRKL